MAIVEILLVDDHRILLEGTKSVIEASTEKFRIKDTAHSVDVALELLKQNDYDVLITDYQMPGMTGMELVQMAKTMCPDLKTIVLSMHDEPSVVKELLKMGVDGFVLKSDTHLEIIEALDRVIEGKIYLTQNISQMLIHHTEKSNSSELSPREQEIVKLIVKEYSTKQIAEILLISEKTVETHRKNILKKTKTTNLVGLTKYAFKHGLA
ncbi:response regulator [Marinoscillum sp.]|uniref:response regulator n=1 Tax=Marinoscillum sp. TaxID=2024838 RepID=UPI003BAA86D6